MKTKIFYATDIHGSEICFKKFINAGKHYGVNVLILGGDLTGKMIVPVIRRSDGSFHADFLGNDVTVRTKEEYNGLISNIRLNGMYPYETDEMGMEDLQKDEKRVEQLFNQLMTESVERWFVLAEERLRDTGVKMIMTGGNDDKLEVERVLKSKKSDVVLDPDGEVAKIDDRHEIISYSYSNPTPWKSPREISEEELEEKIDGMVSRVQDIRNSIFNLHVPPVDSDLDTCAKLDTSVYPPKPILDSGVPIMAGAGSRAVRNVIEKHQPLLGLHGHIHESRGICRLGKTLCINPGSEYSLGVLRGVIVTLEDKGIKSYQLTSG